MADSSQSEPPKKDEKKGIIEKIRDSLLGDMRILGALLYGWLSILGMLYSWSFYNVFDIDIFNFSEPSDFLLIVFSKANIVFYILLGIALSILLVLLLITIIWVPRLTIASIIFIFKSIGNCILWAYEFVKSCILWADGTFTKSFAIAYETFKQSLGDAQDKLKNSLDTAKESYRNIWQNYASNLVRPVRIIIPVVFIVATFYIPHYFAEQEVQQVRQISESIRVTIRQDTAQPITRLPESLLLLGTTSSFHFFYECENDKGENAQKAENGPECKKGRPVVIPTANIAALEFIDAKESGLEFEQVGLPDILASINQLNETIRALKFDATINMQSGEITFDTKAVADAIAKVDSTVAAINEGNETNTGEITNAIESLKLAIVSNPNSDGLVKALTTLNQTVSTLKPTVVSNPGSDELTSALTALTKAIESFKAVANPDPKTAAAVTALNATLRTLNETIASLNIPGAGNLCASGWRKVATIGPFPIGDHDQLEETARECQNQLIPPDQFGNETNGRFTDRQLLLIGRVDITQLSEQARKDYGSDSGLAQARAKWVRDKLVERSQNTEQKEALRRAILLSAGPLHVGENVSDCDRALDRSVEVWACR